MAEYKVGDRVLITAGRFRGRAATVRRVSEHLSGVLKLGLQVDKHHDTLAYSESEVVHDNAPALDNLSRL